MAHDGGTPQSLVTEGRVEADGTITAATSGLTITALDTALYLLDFDGYDASAAHVVLGQPDSTYKATSASTFEVIPSDDAALVSDLGAPGDGVVVRAKQFDGTAAAFSVRIEQIEASVVIA